MVDYAPTHHTFILLLEVGLHASKQMRNTFPEVGGAR